MGKARTTAVPAGAKRPTDRKAKKRRIARVTVPLDPEKVLTLQEERRNLERARLELQRDRDTRVARILTERRASGGDAAGHVMSVDLVRAEVDVAIADELAGREKTVQAALDAVDETSHTYEFHALGNDAYQALLDAHKATDEDHEKVKAEGQGTRALFHADTFGPALVEACCEELTADDVDDMFHGGDWNLSELAELFMAAYECNTQRSVVPR